MDEHIPKAVTEGLRRRGVDVLSAQEAGMSGANDYDQLSLAKKEGRVIFTKDADFLRLHSHEFKLTGMDRMNGIKNPACPVNPCLNMLKILHCLP